MFSGSDVKDEAVDTLNPVVVGNWDGVVNDMTRRLITVDNSVFQRKIFALFQVEFSAEANSLPIFWMDMINPEKIVFLDFLLTVAKDLQAIRADVEGSQLVVQAIGHHGRVFEQPLVSLLAVFRLYGWLRIGSAAEVETWVRRRSHEAFPGIRSVDLCRYPKILASIRGGV